MTTELLSTLTKKIKATLEWLGLKIEDGIAYVKEIVTDRLTAKTIRVQRIEMVDSATGEIYCTWIENGNLKRELGVCDDVINEYVTNPVEETPAPVEDILEVTSPSE